MEAIRTISHITGNNLTLYGLDALKGRTVEVIILPVSEEEKNFITDDELIQNAEELFSELDRDEAEK